MDIPGNFNADLSKLLARILNKPEKVTAVSLLSVLSRLDRFMPARNRIAGSGVCDGAVAVALCVMLQVAT